MRHRVELAKELVRNEELPLESAQGWQGQLHHGGVPHAIVADAAPVAIVHVPVLASELRP